jgi:hypothetical protein
MGGDNVISLVTDRKYVNKCMITMREIRGAGGWGGDMVVLAHPELECYEPFVELCAELRVIALYWPFINVYEILPKVMSLDKIFQYQKLHIFNTYFSAWKKMLYIDAGTRIFHDINFYFGMSRPNVILAHSYSYPEYKTIMGHSFSPTHIPQLYEDIKQKYNVNCAGYLSSLFLFETEGIIKENTVEDLRQLALKYPISHQNDEGIFNLYFKDIFSQLPIWRDGLFIYDYLERYGNTYDKYVMLKMPLTLGR